MTGALDRITAEVTAWPGVHATTGERGEWSFRVGDREVGHLHGDRVLHIALGRTLGTQLFDQGRLGPHPVFPQSRAIGARPIDTEADLLDVVEILRLSYDRLVERHGPAVEA